MKKIFILQKDLPTGRPGFTLLEILLAVVVIGILVGIVIVATNPDKRSADVRNAQRRSDVRIILNAVHQYYLNNNNSLPASITNMETGVCSDAGVCVGLIKLSADLVPAYIASLPIDPSQAAVAGGATGYTIYKNITNGRVTVKAPWAENSALISLTR
ncbi:MAG: prepilin-type N-terminal cleavage/methylation domain-containing protein [Patescibacteria group bacterium]